MMERDYYLYTKTPDEAMGHDVTFVYGAKKGYEAGSKVSFQNSKSVTKNTDTEIKDQKSVASENKKDNALSDSLNKEKIEEFSKEVNLKGNKNPTTNYLRLTVLVSKIVTVTSN